VSRTSRLLDLIQALRQRRRPVTAAKLAEELSVSERTIYRDIQTLIGQGAPIEGEAGLGYVLRPGFVLPPLMFSDDEVEALVLGLRWVAERGDGPLGAAARDAVAKITAVLPDALRERAGDVGLLVSPAGHDGTGPDLADLRRAIRTEHKMRIAYADAEGRASERIIWPLALAFFDQVQVAVAWCETRQDFRHFRTDRIGEMAMLDKRYPKRRRALLAEWRARENIPEQKV
jgi:predicted DNA-binding transcriptional regulator YafY